ncbi:MAG: NAD(P)/FAD-dependent oxidoreductase [Pirellulales bacterium]|nr:NAD(P)/FAD-dependent oxidoreductase [Pirellulales bacterium]
MPAENLPLEYDTVIIGAGMSGLAAGIRLAYYDHRVCVLERHTTIGGLNSFYRLEGRNHDVGLHAITNFTKGRSKRGPLNRALRQLRLAWDQFALCPQRGSVIAFSDANLRFNNDFQFFEAEIAQAFPDQIDAFRNLVGQIADYDDLDFEKADSSAREFVAGFISDPLLRDMIFCPLMYYGNAREHDMDFAQFCILFRSIFMEGLARPWEGIRLVLKSLVRKYKELGGELRLRSGVKELRVENGSVSAVVLDNGTELRARQVISSAGWLETMRLCSDVTEPRPVRPGSISLVETISVLDQQPSELGFSDTTVFFNNSPHFRWAQPEGLVDVSSGVICSPNNFVYDKPLPEGLIRVTCLANYDRWRALSGEEYLQQKYRCFDEMVESAIEFVPDFRHHIVATDTFTPTTIHRFTGHVNGALYGAPEKRYDGSTHLDNLTLCGTDQGLVGTVGALVGGLGMANRILQSTL